LGQLYSKDTHSCEALQITQLMRAHSRFTLTVITNELLELCLSNWC